jgi:hypothetical protein
MVGLLSATEWNGIAAPVAVTSRIELLAECFYRLSVLKQHQGFLSDALTLTTKGLAVIHQAAAVQGLSVGSEVWLKLRARKVALLVSQRRRQESIDECVALQTDAESVNDTFTIRAVLLLRVEGAIAEGQTEQAAAHLAELEKLTQGAKASTANELVDIALMAPVRDSATMARLESLLKTWAAEAGFFHVNAAEGPPAALSGDAKESRERNVIIGLDEEDTVDTCVVGVSGLGWSGAERDRHMLQKSAAMDAGDDAERTIFSPELRPNLYISLVPSLIRVVYQRAKQLESDGSLDEALAKAMECEKLTTYRINASPLVVSDVQFLVASLGWRLFQEERRARLTYKAPPPGDHLLLEANPFVDRTQSDEQKIEFVTSRLLQVVHAHVNLGHSHRHIRAACLALARVYQQLAAGLLEWEHPKGADAGLGQSDVARASFEHWAVYYQLLASQMAAMDLYLLRDTEQLCQAGVEDMTVLPKAIAVAVAQQSGLREALRKEEVALLDNPVGREEKGALIEPAAPAKGGKASAKGAKGAAAAPPIDGTPEITARDLIFYYVTLRREAERHAVGADVASRTHGDLEPGSSTPLILVQLHHFLAAQNRQYQEKCCFKADILAPSASDGGGDLGAGEQAEASAPLTACKALLDELIPTGFVSFTWSDGHWADDNDDTIRLLFTLSGAHVGEHTAESRPLTERTSSKNRKVSKGSKEPVEEEDTGPKAPTFVVGYQSVHRLAILELGGRFGQLRHRLQEESAQGRTTATVEANAGRFHELLVGLHALLAPSLEVESGGMVEPPNDFALDCTLLAVQIFEQMLDITPRGGASFVNAPIWRLLRSFLAPVTIPQAAPPIALTNERIS